MKWKARDGRVLDIRDMSSDHINNCIALLMRNGYCSVGEFWNAVSGAACLQGEYAEMMAEQQIAGMKPTATIDRMLEELDRRRK